MCWVKNPSNTSSAQAVGARLWAHFQSRLTEITRRALTGEGAVHTVDAGPAVETRRGGTPVHAQIQLTGTSAKA